MYFTTVLAAIGNKAIDNGTAVDGVGFFSTFIPRLVSIILIVGSLAFFFMFILGAVRWISSGGDKGQVESARTQITQALTGLVVMFSVYAVALLLNTIFGVDLLTVDLSKILPS